MAKQNVKRTKLTAGSQAFLSIDPIATTNPICLTVQFYKSVTEKKSQVLKLHNADLI